MPLYAIAIDGPFDQPNKNRYVEVLGQAPTPSMFVCQDILTDQQVICHLGKLQLVWLDTSKTKERR